VISLLSRFSCLSSSLVIFSILLKPFSYKFFRHFQLLVWKGLRSFSFFPVPSQFLPSSFPVPSQFLPSSLPVHSQFTPSSLPVHGLGRTRTDPDGPGRTQTDQLWQPQETAEIVKSAFIWFYSSQHTRNQNGETGQPKIFRLKIRILWKYEDATKLSFPYFKHHYWSKNARIQIIFMIKAYSASQYSNQTYKN